jgi:DNA polymerase-3 subunit alpha
MLAWEKELLGLYVSEHPFKAYAPRLQSLVLPIATLGEHTREKSVRIAGVLTSVKKIFTKNNEAMIFAKLEDLSGSVEVVVFPRVLQETTDVWQADRALLVAGRPQRKEGDMKILATTGFEITDENIEEIIDPMNRNRSREERSAVSAGEAIGIHIRLNLPAAIMDQLRRLLESYPGSHPVHFLLEEATGKRRVETTTRIVFDDEVVARLEEVLGKGTVRVLPRSVL